MSLDRYAEEPIQTWHPHDRTLPEHYAPFIGDDAVEMLRRLADPVSGRQWVNINSTADGGGVAEMLRSMVPLARGLGIDAGWKVISGTESFFRVTKKFHNLLQSADQAISAEEMFGVYLDTIVHNASGESIEADLVTVHDPQPLALVGTGSLLGNIVWRCHIDTSMPSATVWRFLLPYVNACDGAIFTMPEFAGKGVLVPQYEINPCIDPLCPKNRLNTEAEAREILRPLFEQSDVDPDRPLVVAISRYDIHKNQGAILEAFKRIRQRRATQLPPYLVFLGNTASDDPEGGEVLENLQRAANDHPDVRFWVNVDDNDRVVGALCQLARVFVHVSTREGFGLVVSEAAWQGCPVVGSSVGGIRKQIVHGETGFVVDPQSVEDIAERVSTLLDDPDLAIEMGRRGHEHIRRHFLVPELVRRYLCLLRYYTGVDNGPPAFRLNGRTHLDLIRSYRSRVRYL